jgi:hypothetical protein
LLLFLTNLISNKHKKSCRRRFLSFPTFSFSLSRLDCGVSLSHIKSQRPNLLAPLPRCCSRSPPRFRPLHRAAPAGGARAGEEERRAAGPRQFLWPRSSEGARLCFRGCFSASGCQRPGGDRATVVRPICFAGEVSFRMMVPLPVLLSGVLKCGSWRGEPCG